MNEPGRSVFAELWVCRHRRGGGAKLPGLGQEPAKGETEREGFDFDFDGGGREGVWEGFTVAASSCITAVIT